MGALADPQSPGMELVVIEHGHSYLGGRIGAPRRLRRRQSQPLDTVDRAIGELILSVVIITLVQSRSAAHSVAADGAANLRANAGRARDHARDIDRHGRPAAF